MTNADIVSMARDMSDVQFELLLRARMRLEAARNPRGHSQTTFAFGCNVKDGEIKDGRWTVYFDYGDNTKGERLHVVMSEALRRRGWDDSGASNLLMIESDAPDAAQPPEMTF